MEKELERWLGQELKKLGCIYMKFVSPGNDGVPDRIVVMPGGDVVFVELKSETGRLSHTQAFQIARLQQKGAMVFLISNKIEARDLLMLAELKYDVFCAP
ncbi:VRR-NUC domain-containing protein [Veillonella sp. VA139]|uniref:VRR-NUC domain-containing protein n=1 Tax=Veillonella sp. VA139 TaxID=741830 RepID=UPI000F8E2063|nr:VRR-NUC domain-containing protein [Veillonella sp. VA139]